MRALLRLVGAAVSAAVLALAVVGASPQAAASGERVEYTVLAADGVTSTDAAAAIERAGGTVIDSNDAVGMFRVTGPLDGFAERVAGSPALAGATRRTPIGRAPTSRPADVEREALDAARAGTAASTDVDHMGLDAAPATMATGDREGLAAAPATTAAGDREGLAAAPATTAAGSAAAAAGMDPLDDKLWGLRMVRSDLARQVNTGDRRVSVGVLDTGMDASNPDIAANFSWALSRNFAPDIPAIDGACEVPSCLDPVGTDDQGHGTHVAGIIGAAANGTGISGVAPNVTLVELKGGQDSGFFFLDSVVNALTYAGDAGLDVVNMSFFLDPWLYNCVANPADSPARQAEQRATIVAMTRALTYAHLHGVTLFGSLGNNHEDLGNPRVDVQSPNFPAGQAYPRTIDNATCLDLPIEGPFVIGVSALGPSTKKADYSNYGTERISVSAPGGWFRDGFGTPTFRTNGNQVLSSYPRKILFGLGLVDADGNITPAGAGLVFRDCTAAGPCGYYTYLQGTSMASPHAAGVAGLIVSRFGKHDPRHPGTLRLEPWKTESMLLRTAAEHACPVPPLQTYTQEGRSAEWNALCTGETNFNGFYGYGIVDALAAVTAPPAWGTAP